MTAPSKRPKIKTKTRDVTSKVKEGKSKKTDFLQMRLNDGTIEYVPTLLLFPEHKVTIRRVKARFTPEAPRKLALVYGQK